MSITEMQERHRPLIAPAEPAADDFTSLVLPAKLETAHRAQLSDVAMSLNETLRKSHEYLLHVHLLLRANFAAPMHSVSEPIRIDGHELARQFDDLARLARALDSIILTSPPRRPHGSQIEDARESETSVPRSSD